MRPHFRFGDCLISFFYILKILKLLPQFWFPLHAKQYALRTQRVSATLSSFCSTLRSTFLLHTEIPCPCPQEIIAICFVLKKLQEPTKILHAKSPQWVLTSEITLLRNEQPARICGGGGCSIDFNKASKKNRNGIAISPFAAGRGN